MRHLIVVASLLAHPRFGVAFGLPATKVLNDKPRHQKFKQPIQMTASFSIDDRDFTIKDNGPSKRKAAATFAGTAALAGALILSRQIVSRAFFTALQAYESSLVKNPLPTKVMTGASLAVVGDYLAQVKDMKESSSYDVPRALSFAAFDLCYRMFQHVAIPFIVMLGQGRVFHALLSAIPLISMSESSIAFTAAMERTFLYQFVLIPFFYYPIFFTFTGFMQGLNLQETIQRAKKSFLPCWKRNLLFWIPTQMVMFGLIQERWQIPFVCVMGIIWSLILSVTAGGANKK